MPALVCELITTINALAKGTKSPGYYGYGGPEFMSWLANKNSEPHRTLMGKKTLKVLSSLPDAAKDEEYRKMAQNQGWVVSSFMKKSDWPGLEIISDTLTDHVARWKGDNAPKSEPSEACR